MEISSVPLFAGIQAEELPALFNCVQAGRRQYAKGSVLLQRGDKTDRLGVVLSGAVHILREDFWGNRTIVGLAGPATCLPSPIPVCRKRHWRSAFWPRRTQRSCF